MWFMQKIINNTIHPEQVQYERWRLERPLSHRYNGNVSVRRRASDFACIPAGRDMQSGCAL